MPLAVAALAAVAAVIWAVWLSSPVFPLDDAYIVQHSVDSLFNGETRYIGASPFDGITSKAHLLLIAALALVIPVPWAQLVVTAIGAILYVVGVYRLARAHGSSNLWAIALIALSVLTGLTLLHLLNGLETGLAMAATVWTFVWFQKPVPARSWHYGILGLLPFIRPELAALTLLVAARAFWHLYRNEKRFSDMARAACWIAAAALPFVVLSLLLAQSLLPGTATAKAYFFAQGCRPIDWKFFVVVLAALKFASGLGLAAVGLPALLFSPLRWIAFLFIAVFLAAYTVNLPGALFHNSFRYAYLLIPFAVEGWAALLACPGKVVQRPAQGLLLVGVAIAALNVTATWASYRDQIDFSREELAGVSDWVVANIPAEKSILVHDAGYISLRGKHRLVDLVGLKTPSSVEAHRRFTWETCTRDQRALDTIAAESGADFLVVFDHWDRSFEITSALRAAGWRLTRVDAERGKTAYSVFKLEKPDTRRTPRPGAS